MDLIQLLILLVIVGICGAVAEWIVGFNPGGLLLTIVVGVIGAYFGGWLGSELNRLTGFELPLFGLFEIAVGTTEFNLLWAVIGSILLLVLLNLLRSSVRRQQLRRP